MSRFFINRPIFASVISIIIVIAGLIASKVLPIAQYPEIAPPTVLITASYPGASAETLSKTVAAPIEEQLSGIEGLSYFNSSAASDGTLTITATFKVGTNVDVATMYVNNRVKIAEPRLPDVVRQYGVVVQKRSNDILLFTALKSPKGSRDTIYLSNYASANIVDVLKRQPGVGDAVVLGARDYSMRIWLRPDRMAQLGVTSSDIAAAIRAQNTQNVAGKIGQQPAPSNQQLVYTVTAKGRLATAEEFGNIVLRASGPGGILRLRDVARVELGAQNYETNVTLDGKPTIGIAIYLQSGANALDTATNVRNAMAELKTKFPEDVDYIIPFDTTNFVRTSIKEVVQTLAEAMVLVILVVFVFLQNWRATLIPIIAVPVSLIGTFGGLWLFGFSLNTLTLFAMVLSIGIVVDDAIVVLENVERLMHDFHLPPKEAAIEAMREVSSAVVAIVLVLCAVFVPVAFLGGIAGKLYQQFAVTVAISVVISGIVALTLTPALCALLLKPVNKEGKLAHAFNSNFLRFTNFYTGLVGKTLRHGIIGTVVFVAVIVSSIGLFQKVPGGFVPEEDMGYMITALMLPDAASLNRTDASGAIVRDGLLKKDEIEHVFVVSGFDLIGGGNKTSAGTIFTILKPWEERKATSWDLIPQFMGLGMMLPDGLGITFNPPPIRGLGTAGGFEVYVQSRLDTDPKKLSAVVNEFVGALKKRPEMNPQKTTTFFRPTVPQLFVEVDQDKVLSLDIPLTSVYETLQSTIGTFYINDFNKYGRTYRVQLQADPSYRIRPQDIGKAYVRSNSGNMVPLSTLIKVRSIVGPEQIERYNGYLSAKVLGEGKLGVSSGDVIKLVEQTAAEVLPPGYEIAWTGQAFQEKQTASTSSAAFIFGIIMVFLILAAQFEKWSLPLAVILAVPFALFGALLAVLLRAMPNDIYFQIGLVTLIGLAAKNAILIVEFAAQQQAEGKPLKEAALEAARLRFRPIVMTSLAFVLGVFPLVISGGAGGAARRSMGTGVFGGMLAATFIATIFVPLFYTWLSRGKLAHVPPGHPDLHADHSAGTSSEEQK